MVTISSSKSYLLTINDRFYSYKNLKEHSYVFYDLPAVRRTQPITLVQHFFTPHMSPCYDSNMVNNNNISQPKSMTEFYKSLMNKRFSSRNKFLPIRGCQTKETNLTFKLLGINYLHHQYLSFFQLHCTISSKKLN